MTMKLFNHTYFLMVLISVGILIGLYFIFKNKSERSKKLLVLLLMLLNVFQHLFKSIVWPHLYGTGFNRSNTLYNMCALLICLSPISFFIKSNSLKTANYLIGSIAGFGAICFPYWFWNSSIFTWDFLRFYTCHLLLFLSSFLSLLFKIAEIKFKDFYKIGLYYLLFCFIMLFNNLCWAIINSGLNPSLIFVTLYSDNACYIMSPPKNLDWLVNIVEALSPSIFLGNDKRYYVPILWSAIPVYIFITLLSLIVITIITKIKDRN